MTSKSVKPSAQEGRKRPAAGRHYRQSVETLLTVSQMIAGTLERDALLTAAMGAAAEAMSAEACSILLEDPDSGELHFHIVKGEHVGGLSRAQVPIDDTSIAGWVAKHAEPLLIVDAYEDSRFDPGYDQKTGFRTKSVICVPLKAKGRQLGVIQVLNRHDGKPFDTADLGLSEAVASLIAVAIHTAEEHEARLAAERIATVGQTIAGLAHCIKNILNGLQAGSYVIDRNIEGDDVGKVRRGWEMVKRNMGLLSNIVLDMLSYSKGRRPVCRPCRLNDLCTDVLALLTEQAKGRGVVLTSTLCEELPEVSIDESAIKRCLINMVGNAIDACEENKGVVTVQTRPETPDGRFALCVRDNGCGIEPAALEKIFDPFYSTKGAKGTGLGLAVTRKIIEEHSGTLRIDSTPGQGTEFIIELPAEQGAGGAG